MLWQLPALSETAPLLEVPADLPCQYGVLGIDASVAGCDTLVVTQVRLRSPAEAAGLRPGDRLLGVLPYRVRTRDQLSRCIQSLAPGTRAFLLVERQGTHAELTATVADLGQLYYLMGEGPEPGRSGPRHARWAAQPGRFAGMAEELIRRLGGWEGYAGLRLALAEEAGRYGNVGRLHDLQHVLLDPLAGSQVAEATAADFAAGDLAELLILAGEHLDLVPVGAAPQPPVLLEWMQACADSPLFQVLLQPFFRAGLESEQAFAGLCPAEQEELLSLAPGLLQRFGASRSLDDGDSAQVEGDIRALRLAKRVDRARLLQAGGVLACLTSREALREIARLARQPSIPVAGDPLPPAFEGRLLYARLSPWGWILVGDEGPNVYGGDAALILDLGGDDQYLGNGGSPLRSRQFQKVWRRSPAGLLIDYGGNDRYLGNRPGDLGAAMCGVGMLLDLGGDDLYQGMRLCQGAAFCGLGILWDRFGDDVYLAAETSQGAAFFGAGFLLDDAGDDLYASALLSQAFGGAGGLGLLVDRDGSDRYLADRPTPASYGLPDAYDGWSQGVGCGFRGYAPGGLGLLLELGGDDVYQAGTFCQGTGYFFGLGLVVDRGGDDVYRGGRYAQGSGAHQAVGILVDQAGRDRYIAGPAAAQGAGWDAAVGILDDGGGDDVYQAEELAQGAAAMNGVGVLRDRSGSDRYQARVGQGLGGQVGYWGGRGAGNLGILIDEGGQSDTYDLPGRKDQAELAEPGLGLFLDR